MIDGCDSTLIYPLNHQLDNSLTLFNYKLDTSLDNRQAGRQAGILPGSQAVHSGIILLYHTLSLFNYFVLIMCMCFILKGLLVATIFCFFNGEVRTVHVFLHISTFP